SRTRLLERRTGDVDAEVPRQVPAGRRHLAPAHDLDPLTAIELAQAAVEDRRAPDLTLDTVDLERVDHTSLALGGDALGLDVDALQLGLLRPVMDLGEVTLDLFVLLSFSELVSELGGSLGHKSLLSSLCGSQYVSQLTAP